MTHTVLKAADEATMLANLKSVDRGLTYVDEDGADQFSQASHDHALHLIGPLVLVDGVYDSEGAEITPPVMDNAFHALLQVNDEVKGLLDAVSVGFVLSGDAEIAVTSRHGWL